MPCGEIFMPWSGSRLKSGQNVLTPDFEGLLLGEKISQNFESKTETLFNIILLKWCQPDFRQKSLSFLSGESEVDEEEVVERKDIEGWSVGRGKRGM